MQQLLITRTLQLLGSITFKVRRCSFTKNLSQKRIKILNTLLLGVSLLLYDIGRSTSVRGQVIPDNTLGNESSVVKPFNSLNDLIDGGAKRGANLFHSFQEFNVGEGRGVYFLRPSGEINNIITRVTGTNPSRILGTLGVYDNANLFLINPNGIVFGPNARLALGGSFVASTASSVIFDGFEFSTINPQSPPLMTVNIPIGLRFRDNPGAIRVNNSRLEVRPEIDLKISPPGEAKIRGTTLVLAGGEISLDGGGLIANLGSQVELGSLYSAGTVGINSDNNGLRLNFPNESERADISLNNGAFILTNSVALNTVSSFLENENILVPSRLTIHARNINILDGSQLITMGAPFTSRFPLPTGDITINATGAVVIERSLISNNSGGNITIRSQSFSLINGSQLSNQMEASPLFFPTQDSQNIFLDQKVGTGTISLQVDDLAFIQDSSIAIILKATPPMGVTTPVPPTVPGIGILPITTPSIFQSLPTENKTIPDPAPFTYRIFTSGITANIAEAPGNIIPAIPRLIEQRTPKPVFASPFDDADLFFGYRILDSQANTGSINIIAKSLYLTDTAQLFISSETALNQFAVLGNVNINVRNDAKITGRNSGAFIDIGNSNQVLTGNINLKANSLSLADGAQLQTSISGDASLDKAGSIGINVSGTVSLSNSRIASVVPGRSNNVGDITLNANSVFLNEGGRLITSTEGSGNAGNIQVRTNDFINITGTNTSGVTSGLFAGTNSTGKGGDITVETPRFRIADSAAVDARTGGQGLGGNILVKADTFEAINSGKLTTTTLGKEQAGNITFYVSDSINLQGAGSGLFANTAPNSTGRGGNIFVNSRTVTIRDGAGIAVNSQGTGQAGDMSLQAGSLVLDNQAFLLAETTSNQGGNINLQVQDLLLLRRDSRISTTAGTESGSGAGGNISIDTRFLVALPRENSDITANSFGGSGGNITITADGIFGSKIQNQLTNNSDITAFSQLDPSLNGQILFNTPDVDPSSGLIELPQTVVDPDALIAQNPCTLGKGSEFIVTGRGGLPPSPNETLSGRTVRVSLVEPTQASTNRSNTAMTVRAPRPDSLPIVPAQGWILNEKGLLVFTAYDPTATGSNRLGRNTPTCPAR